MNLHEYQSKRLFADYAIPTLPGAIADSPEAAMRVAAELGGDAWVVKAQAHTGGRGKAGGVQKTDNLEQLGCIAEGMLTSPLVTQQSGPDGLPVDRVLIESVTTIQRELYLSVLSQRAEGRVLFMASEAGGVDIETVAEEAPEKILLFTVNPVAGLQDYQARKLAFRLGFTAAQRTTFARILHNLYRLFMDLDASQVEINPLIVNDANELVALDAKINLDDNALYAHPELVQLRDLRQEDSKESLAREHGLNYITLSGTIGCMVNGAGLAMATMDLVKLSGASPANFLDVGGQATAEKVAEAFKLILSDINVKAILVNIFGGIVRCDMIAEGIIQAIEKVHVNVPVVVRLEGTNAEAGRALLDASVLDIVAAGDLAQAAEKVVELAGRQQV